MIITSFEKLAADYLRISVPEVDDLPLFYYLQIRRDAFIKQLRESEQGREYLSEAWRLNQTEPDREASRREFGGRGVHG